MGNGTKDFCVLLVYSMGENKDKINLQYVSSNIYIIK